MGTLADLLRASELFEEGHRHLAVFASGLVKQIGVRFDFVQQIVVTKDSAKWRKYGRWLEGQETGPCPFDADAAGLEQIAERLYLVHTRWVLNLRRIEADGDALPVHFVHNRTPGWVQPRFAEESIPWSILGHPFPCAFLQPKDVDDALYMTFWSRGAGREKPDWLFKELPRLEEQLASWRKWFADVERRLKEGTPGGHDALTDLQKKIMRALWCKSLGKDALGEAVSKDPSVLYRRGGVKELLALGLVKNNRKIGGYYRPDAPPVD